MPSNEYMREYMRIQYTKRRTQAIQVLGGHCVVCGTEDDLQVDHVDRRSKTTRDIYRASLAVFLEQLTVCQLLCRRHHQEKTSRENAVDHGGGASGKRNCPCDPCRQRKREYMRTYARPDRASTPSDC